MAMAIYYEVEGHSQQKCVRAPPLFDLSASMHVPNPAKLQTSTSNLLIGLQS